MKCPCEDCLCVPVCRYKGYLVLLECSLLNEYLIKPYDPSKRPIKRLQKTKKILHPTRWTYDMRDYGGKSSTWIICN